MVSISFEICAKKYEVLTESRCGYVHRCGLNGQKVKGGQAASKSLLKFSSSLDLYKSLG